MTQLAKTILVVEDNQLNMKLVSDLLQAHGYNVLQAGEGGEGLKLARERRPDLILLDIQLPDISGLEVNQRLKEDEDLRSIPVIALNIVVNTFNVSLPSLATTR